ncbi:LOB domain-containing protein 6-like [Diospyros lotus]|uniref:LOB domain-containing protein 6-like n=1 Tax=Diospyros lotus TaxID=55363 RepID=UPI00225393B9|nr:LOB domain-containing protein 6-like [Diospyros lotus]
MATDTTASDVAPSTFFAASVVAPDTTPTSNSQCGACKFLRRKCIQGCVFAPHFNHEQGPISFAAIHTIFGARNTSKLLAHLPVDNLQVYLALLKEFANSCATLKMFKIGFTRKPIQTLFQNWIQVLPEILDTS